jgi:hypothetical protein
VNELLPQTLIYESLAFLGPVWSAVCAGFAVIVFDKVYITPSGERYLEAVSQGQADGAIAAH